MKVIKRMISAVLMLFLMVTMMPQMALTANAEGEAAVHIEIRNFAAAGGSVEYWIDEGAHTTLEAAETNITVEDGKWLHIQLIPDSTHEVDPMSAAYLAGHMGDPENKVAAFNDLGQLSYTIDARTNIDIQVEFRLKGSSGGPGGSGSSDKPVSVEIINSQNGRTEYKTADLNDGAWSDDFTRLNSEPTFANGTVISFRAKPNQDQSLDMGGCGLMVDGVNHNSDIDFTALQSDEGWSLTIEEGKKYQLRIEYKGESSGGESGPRPGAGLDPMTFNFNFQGPNLTPLIRISKDGDVEDGSTIAHEKTVSGKDISGDLSRLGITQDGQKFVVSVEVEMDMFTNESARFTSIKIGGQEQAISKAYGRNNYEVEYHKNGNLTIDVSAESAYVYTIMWANEGADVAGTDFDNPEVKLTNGSAYVYKVYNNKTEMKDISSTVEGTEAGVGCVDDKGRGYMKVEAGNIVEFEFIPKYGHQLVKIQGNGSATDDRDAVAIGAQERINTYRFEMPKTNVHFYAEFAEQPDVVTSEVPAVNSNGSAIKLGDGELADGTAQLSINKDTLTAAQAEKAEQKAEEAGFDEVYSNVNIDLNQVFYKGSNDDKDVWKNEHNTLNKPASVTLSLGESQEGFEVSLVHEKHDGSFEVLPATVDKDGNITFETKSFSNYSIVRKALHTHKGVLVKAKEETCKKDGNIKYYQCDCGKKFLDAKCTKEVEDVVIKAAHKEKIKVISAATMTKNGKVSVSCERCKKTLNKSKTIYAAKTVKLTADKLVYTGKTLKITAAVKDSKKHALVAGKDYKVSVKGTPKKVGEYKVTITGIGAYKYTKELKCQIVPKAVELKSVASSKKSLVASWNKGSQITGYELAYSTDKKFAAKKTKTADITKAGTTKTTIKKLAKKTYYVKIRAYKTVGKTNKIYSDWSRVLSVKIK